MRLGDVEVQTQASFVAPKLAKIPETGWTAILAG
jgi:hypothetical protein